MMRLAIFGCAFLAFCVFGPGPEPARAEWGFFSSLREMFGTSRRVRPRVRPRPRADMPAVTFAYAHHAGRYKRYRYSHQTPYAYYRHPYRHGFVYTARPAPQPRRRSRRNFNRQLQYHFSPDGRVRPRF